MATTNNAVDEALSRPAGARWIRAALQVNPYGYEGAAAPFRAFTNESAYNEALLARCRDLGIELIAVTDHWSVDRSQGLLTAAAAAGLTALAGFEANTSEGVHLLVIFEQGTPVSTVNAAIGECGADPGCPNGTTGRSFRDVLEAMTRRKALIIPAHVNVAARGLLHAVSGVPLQQMVVHPQLQALAVTPSQPETADQASVLAGRPPFARAHPLAVVHADDVCHPDQLDLDGATTWFKVSAPSLASVRVAVRTSGTRVRVEPASSSARTVLRALAWRGGFLDGVRLAISPELTAFIGGRGTGKSTVIETIRYLLDQAPLGTTAQREHQEFVREVLRPGTTCSLVVDAVRPAAGRYIIERTVPEPPLVRDASGTVTQLRPEDLVGVVEVFGQHELAELAQDKACVARMLERLLVLGQGRVVGGDRILIAGDGAHVLVHHTGCIARVACSSAGGVLRSTSLVVQRLGVMLFLFNRLAGGLLRLDPVLRLVNSSLIPLRASAVPAWRHKKWDDLDGTSCGSQCQPAVVPQAAVNRDESDSQRRKPGQ